MKEATHSGGLIRPDALAALFAFQKANRLTLLRIEELMGKVKRSGTHRTIRKAISWLCLLIAVHVPYFTAVGAKLGSELSFRHLGT